MSTKTLISNEDIVQSLINLRDELWERKNPDLNEAFYKINSCLYRGYKLTPKPEPQPSPWKDGAWNLKYAKENSNV